MTIFLPINRLDLWSTHLHNSFTGLYTPSHMNSFFQQAVAQMQQHMNHFGPLTKEEWDALTPHLSMITFKKHQNFVQQGSIAN
jgi:hypothetical protein